MRRRIHLVRLKNEWVIFDDCDLIVGAIHLGWLALMDRWINRVSKKDRDTERGHIGQCRVDYWPDKDVRYVYEYREQLYNKRYVGCSAHKGRGYNRRKK